MVNKPTRGSSGKYTIKGKSYPELFGSRHQVWNGTAYKTAGELTKVDLIMNKWGRIVSRKKHHTAKKEKRLQKYGFFAQKGKFGYVRKTRRRTRGGDGEASPPAAVEPETPSVPTQEDIDLIKKEAEAHELSTPTEPEFPPSPEPKSVSAPQEPSAPAPVESAPSAPTPETPAEPTSGGRHRRRRHSRRH